MKKLIISLLLILSISADSKNIGVTYRSRYTISSICAHTNYKEACITTLSPLFHRNTTSPRNVLHAAISGALEAVTNAGSSFDGLFNDANDDEAIVDCHELVGYAVGELRDSLSIVDKNDLPTIFGRKPDLMTWLSAVVTDQETCLDGFEDRPQLRRAMSDVLLQSTQLTSNALGIVDGMPNIFKRFYIPVSTRGIHRRGYPWWVSKP